MSEHAEIAKKGKKSVSPLMIVLFVLLIIYTLFMLLPLFWGLPKQSIISYHFEHQHPILDTLTP